MTGTAASFDAPLLIDAVSKAAKVAPTKGEAFDKVAGIYLEVTPAKMVITATNINSTYRQEVAVLNYEPPEDHSDVTHWRIPSTIFSNLLSALPMTEGTRVKLAEREPGFLKVMSGSTDAQLALLTEPEPHVTAFDITADMADGNSLPGKLSSVSWAVKRKENGPLGGVRIDGTRLVATDGVKLALVPCEIPIVEPITIDASQFASLLKSASDVRVRAEDSRLCVTMDAETQATTRIFLGPYPRYEALLRDNFLGSVQISRTDWLDVLQRMLTIIGSEQYPHLNINIGGLGNMLAMDMSTPSGDRIADSVPCVGDVTEECSWGIIPFNVIQALQASSAGIVTLRFGNSTDPSLSHKSTCAISDPTGYTAIISAKVRR